MASAKVSMLKEFLSIFSILYDVKAQIIKVLRCFLFLDKEKKGMFGFTSTKKYSCLA